MPKQKEHIREFPLYGLLLCGIILLIIGTYMLMTDSYGVGFAQRNRNSAGVMGKGYINGYWVIAFGAIFTIIPLWILKAQGSFKKRPADENSNMES